MQDLINRTTEEGTKLDNMVSQYELKQILTDPTHISKSHTSCTGLIFTRTKLISELWHIHASLHENCHYKITCSKFDLKMFYPPPDEKTIWHYKDANSHLLKIAIYNFNWKKAFKGCDPNKQVNIFDWYRF